MIQAASTCYGGSLPTIEISFMRVHRLPFFLAMPGSLLASELTDMISARLKSFCGGASVPGNN
jgi:hypothetical protein